MPGMFLPPIIIRRTVSDRVLPSSSAYFGKTRKLEPLNLSGQWQFSHVSRAGTRRLLSRADGIGLGCVLEMVWSNWRTPFVLLATHPAAPGATWHSTHSTRECGEFW